MRTSSPSAAFARLPSPPPNAPHNFEMDQPLLEMRSRSATAVKKELATRRKYALAAMFLVLSLVSFVVQTETAVHIQSALGWKKPYLML
jgi:hypothetical protein